MIKPIWIENDSVKIIAQTLLPNEYQVREIGTIEEMWQAIKTLDVRGAPALGVASALGTYLGVRNAEFSDRDGFIAAVENSASYICTSRPTAYNLFWAADQIREMARKTKFENADLAIRSVLDKANAIIQDDLARCRSIGLYGAGLLGSGKRFLTHCNAGALATAGGYGTALAPIYIMHEQGREVSVIADETRPLLQGARLTAWELSQTGIPVTVICDNMAGMILKKGGVDAIIVGADRITANGDAANKIGTYALSVLARHHNVPFYVAAPFSTIDFSLNSGDQIPIEQRDSAEVSCFGGVTTTPAAADIYNPAFDVTGHDLIDAIITELGVARAPYTESLPRLLRQGQLRF
jgi:methylthioribose-1-phosphate isomerase